MTRAAFRSERCGATFVNVLVVAVAIVVIACFLFPAVHRARIDTHANACRDNLGRIARAAILYDERNGKYPGYMNCLITKEGNAYRDLDTLEPTPVSWAVELLADLDRRVLYEEWRRDWDPAIARFATAIGDTARINRPNTNVYLEVLVCPGDFSRPTSGTPLSYVANTGMPDLPSAIPSTFRKFGPPDVGMPRDWGANGMLFDNYSDDRLIKTPASDRGPQVVMRSGGVRDPKAKTIFFSENLDAKSYVYRDEDFPDGNPALTEVAWGSVWASGKIEPDPHATAEKPTPIMTPRDDVSAPNALNDDRPHPFGYKYCRPSSPHPGGYNVAFVAGNVVFMNDSLSYFVYARLMASDDLATKLPGQQTLMDAAFRGPIMIDHDLNP